MDRFDDYRRAVKGRHQDEDGDGDGDGDEDADGETPRRLLFTCRRYGRAVGRPLALVVLLAAAACT
ncbi:MAG: hypothetical protein ACXWW9_07340, partial [Actinomycetota bacterium]